MSKFMVIESYPISKHKTDNYMLCYVDNEKQANLVVNNLSNKVKNLRNKLIKKYSPYLSKSPHCKMHKYISGLFDIDFIAVEVTKYSHELLKTKVYEMTDYPKNFDLASDEVKLNNIIKSHTEK